MIIKELIKHLQSYPEDMPVACHLWQPDDVASIWHGATLEQCAKVLELVESHKDSSIGISWDTICCAVGDVKEREMDEEFE